MAEELGGEGVYCWWVHRWWVHCWKNGRSMDVEEFEYYNI